MNNQSVPPAAGQAAEPLHFILRGIVALSENMIDDQDPKAVIDLVTVNEAARSIRRTANGAMKQAVRLHESQASLVEGLQGARAALMCYWHHNPSKMDAEIARIDSALQAAQS